VDHGFLRSGAERVPELCFGLRPGVSLGVLVLDDFFVFMRRRWKHRRSGDLPHIDSGLVAPLISLALLLPDVAVSIRRLHDLDRSGWWLLICFTGIGIIVLLVWDCMRGTLGPNRFGPDPIAPPALPAAVQT
jgi:uncharacterized membrane protein YhaH (DUF805 family)